MHANRIWDRVCAEYLRVRGTPKFNLARERRRPALRAAVAALRQHDFNWLRDALSGPDKKWFVAFLFEEAPLPEQLFEPMIQAAIREPDPSANRAFVEPCVDTFGHRRVNRRLLDVFKAGSDAEKAGATRATYWARTSLTFEGKPPRWDLEHATPESRERYLALSDLRHEHMCLFLEEFVSNPNLHLRQCLIPNLVLNPDRYPPALQPLVARAIELARNHPDEYIRHRVEVQLGNGRLLKPLPD